MRAKSEKLRREMLSLLEECKENERIIEQLKEKNRDCENKVIQLANEERDLRFEIAVDDLSRAFPALTDEVKELVISKLEELVSEPSRPEPGSQKPPEVDLQAVAKSLHDSLSQLPDESDLPVRKPKPKVAPVAVVAEKETGAMPDTPDTPAAGTATDQERSESPEPEKKNWRERVGLTARPA